MSNLKDSNHIHFHNCTCWLSNQAMASPENCGPATLFQRQRINPALKRRQRAGSLRKLRPYHQPDGIDFASNDYLGLAQSPDQHQTVELAYARLPSKSKLLGSTGSRLVTGDSDYATSLEKKLARWHNRPAALLCNSGYDANLSVMSALTMDSVVIMDEICHNSIQMGVRLGIVKSFLHNSLLDLEKRLQESQRSFPSKPVLIVVESVYSMDGDMAPLEGVFELAMAYRACVIVDEAHSLGVLGTTGMGALSRLGLEKHPALLCSIHTFGKAAGCHGAVVCGSTELKQYLYNYGRPIVYSTSLPIHSLVTIECSYNTMRSTNGSRLRHMMNQRVKLFRNHVLTIMDDVTQDIFLVESTSPIQALIVPGNTACIDFCDRLWSKSNRRIRLYPIRSPTVPKGQERIRIIVHAHNSENEVVLLTKLIRGVLTEMGYIRKLQSKL